MDDKAADESKELRGSALDRRDEGAEVYRRQAMMLDRLYRRLGPAYPTTCLAVELSAAFPLVTGALFLFRAYFDVSSGEFLGLLGLTLALSAAAVTVTLVRGHMRLRPVRDWIRGNRSPEQSIAAWRTAVSLPLDAYASSWYQRPLALVVGTTIGAAVIADLSWAEALIVFVAAWLVIGYSVVLDYLSLESGLRPVVRDIAANLPDDFDFGSAELPLSWKLLASLPLINVITGVVVASLSSAGDEVAQLGLDMLTATAVAFTVSLLLTLRLTHSVVRPVDELAAAAARVERGDFDTKVHVTTADEIGRLARAFNKMIAGLEERERIRDAFGTYVDREVAEHILSEGTSLEGEEVEVTMMFIDVRDFTAFAERAAAPEVVAMLNRLFDRVVPIIHKHHGHVDKFVGDGLLAVFGAPQRQRDHADQALGAALEIERVVGGEFDGKLEIGVGLNSGRVVAGNVGGGGRLGFTVIGDAVNTAARVEAATRETGDTVLIAEGTRRLLRSETVSLEERSGVTLKGKAEPVQLYAAIRAEDAARVPEQS